MANTSKRLAVRAKRKSRPLAFPVEFRLRIVKLYHDYLGTIFIPQLQKVVERF
jgi:hypothetical protein